MDIGIDRQQVRPQVDLAWHLSRAVYRRGIVELAPSSIAL